MSSNSKGLSSPLGKKIMGYAYGIGASIVIIGALFKILHLPGSGLMLTLGMGTEALLFFLGSFEAPHQEATHWDWTKVYPNLVPLKSPEEQMLVEKTEQKLEQGKKVNKKHAQKVEELQIRNEESKAQTPKLGAMSALSGDDMEQWNENIKNIVSTVDGLSKLAETGKISESYINKLSNASDAVDQLSKAQEASAELITSSTEHLADNYKVSSEKFDLTMTTAAEKFDTTMESAADVIKKDFEGASQKASEVLSGSTEKFASAYLKTADQFGTTMETVTEVVKKDLEGASQKASETLKGSTESIAASYEKTAEKFEKTFISAYTDSAAAMSKASAALSDSYMQVTDALNQKLKTIEGATAETGKTLASVGKNLSAINSVYELQLTAINEELKIKEAQTATQGSVNDQLSLIQKAVSEALSANMEYQEGSKKLNNNIAELNKVYGNMLNSLNS